MDTNDYSTPEPSAEALGPITGKVAGQYFGFFDGVPKAHYDEIVASAPFDQCNLLILAFVHAVQTDGEWVAEFTNWRDNHVGKAGAGDTDADRVKLVVEAARAKNPDLKILISLGWGTNDAGDAAKTPAAFAASVAQLAQTYDLDGFDIDFESTEIEPQALLGLADAIRSSLSQLTPARTPVMTITPAQTAGLNAEVLGRFDYVMPQTYQNGGNGTTAEWFAQQLGSYDKIVYGVNSESGDNPIPDADEMNKNAAAGLFAWRLDNDSVNAATGYPTFAIGRQIWKLTR